MSWGISVPNTRYADAADAINGAAPSPDSTTPEQEEQVAAAKAAAIEVIKSGVVVNDASQDVSISITGHANPEHKGNDSLSISVYQVPRAATDA